MTLSKKLLATFLILVDFALLHYIVSSIPLRFDFTQERIYTLSDSTESMLSKIEDPITIDFYSSRSISDLPSWFLTFADQVEQMMEQYERSASGKIRLNIIDPKPDTLEEERAIAAGLHGQEIATGDRVFLGMVISQGDSEKALPFFDWNRETFLEYDISKSIYEAQQFTKPRIGVLSTLPLIAPQMPTMPGQPPQEDQFFITQLATQFEVVAIEPTASILPQDLDLLAIVHPKDLNVALRYEIDQFALSGKPIFLAVDPSSIQDREQARQMQMMGGGMNQNSASDLPDLLASWGIEYDPSKVAIDPNNSIAQANYIQPAWLIFQDEFTNRDLLPSSDLEGILLLEAAPLAQSENATTDFEPVLTTTDEAATAQSMMLQFQQGNALWKNAEPIGHPTTLAALVTGTANTAFPDGPPPAESPEDDPDPATVNQLSSGNITVFVISDTDWLLDRFSIQRANFLGMASVQKLNDNQTLASNFVEYLGGSRDLIGIRGKGNTDRTYDVVRAMEVEAQKAYQTKLDAIEAELSETNSKLTELLGQQTNSGFIAYTPELEALITENQKKQAELKSQRREIRHNLRQGIDTLGNSIGLINIAWAPFALLAFGLFFNRQRKRG